MLLIIHKIELFCEHWFFHEPFLYLLDDSREEKAEKPRRVYNNVDRCELEMLQGAFITAVDTVEKDDRVFLDAVKVENGKLIHLGFVLDDEGVFLNFEE